MTAISQLATRHRVDTMRERKSPSRARNRSKASAGRCSRRRKRSVCRPANHWSLRLFVGNLTNVRRGAGLAFRNLAFGNDGNWYLPIGRSRQSGIELEWKL